MLQSGDADGGGGGAALALQTDHTLGLDAVPGACSQVVQDQLLGTRLPLDPVLQRGEEDGSNGRTLILFYFLMCFPVFLSSSKRTALKRNKSLHLEKRGIRP